ncbi:uncharacterized protein KY384_004836 [Bacidia gigantensis]|uniref:uncharacterized protein n=1 Tax=Bacidia gigantensis TaxID=2732470 RepID=UPI001D049F8D|nr:uncharacterized protein KY384_004836 [Bacidia gigantensis]KAG8530334.1 hypothetical protein KY384_004836 [Bacidia gigantensis]
MLCATVSGEPPQDPVISPKSGNIFERRLIENYLQENGKDPITNDELSAADLITIKSNITVKPRPPTLTSIPSLLSVFQNEWEAIALETFTLRQHLTEVRQELSNALYENDAAKRVVARLQKERDEARDALAKVQVSTGARPVNGEQMEIDGQELNPKLVKKVEATQEKLSKTRRKRPVPDGWALDRDIESFAPATTSEALFPNARSMAIDTEGDLVLSGGSKAAGIFAMSQNKLEQDFDVDSPVTAVLLAGSKPIFATEQGTVTIFDEGKRRTNVDAHSGQAAALALHPSGDIMASVGTDKSYVFYDLATGSKALRVATDTALTSAQFHPDGHLFAAGGVDGQIKIYDTKTGANAANFEENGPIGALDFSENGTWLAAVVKGSQHVSVWDLRKSSKIQELDMGGPVVTLRWDYTGQFLAAGGPGGLTVQSFNKGKKEWSQLLATAVPAAALAWGPQARSLVVVNAEGVFTVLRAG